MARSRKSEFEELMDVLADAPWWVSVLVAGVCYLAVRFGIPATVSGEGMLDDIFIQLSDYAWLSAIFLVPGLFSALRSLSKRRRLDRQWGIESIRALPWRQFEKLLGETYRRQGYSVLENSGAGADGGVDLTIRKGDAVYLVQCKQWRMHKVGVKVVREMLGLVAAHRAAGAIVVTSGAFTKEAREFAARQPVELIDGRALVRLVAAVQTHPVVAAPTAVVMRFCPRCGRELVPRRAHRGPQAGAEFWGCSGYPECRHTEQATG